MADVLITHETTGDVTAVCRGLFGVFDTGRTDGRWWCSCSGSMPCVHVERVEAVLADRRHNDELTTSRGETV
ncbi:MAG: hypothetical protein WB565_00110 [Acidimicrobiales bacterium]